MKMCYFMRAANVLVDYQWEETSELVSPCALKTTLLSQPTWTDNVPTRTRILDIAISPHNLGYTQLNN